MQFEPKSWDDYVYHIKFKSRVTKKMHRFAHRHHLAHRWSLLRTPPTSLLTPFPLPPPPPCEQCRPQHTELVAAAGFPPAEASTDVATGSEAIEADP